MINARTIVIDSWIEAKEEITKIGTDTAAWPWLTPKAVFLTVKIYHVSPFAAGIIKQEMLSKGGDVAVDKGVANYSAKRSELLIMGTISQYKRLIAKLKIQSGVLIEIGAELQKIVENVVKGKPEFLFCGRYMLPMGKKTYVMGILNLTPDSFSDGGNYGDIEAAVNRAKAMVQEGAHIIDVGGESTKPGYQSVDEQEEIKRVMPVVERLCTELNVPISIDTTKAAVAQMALKAGAHIVNDQWGLKSDPNMAGVVAKYGAGLVLMHNQKDRDYDDMMGDIVVSLRESMKIAKEAGIQSDRIIIDPGIGFGKTGEQNMEVIRKLRELNVLNVPILLGPSRKSFIGNVLDLPVNERLEGTSAAVTLGIANGADIVRVHDVKEISRVAKMTDAIMRRKDKE